MSANATDIWIATSDGRNMIRADAIVVVRMDRDRVTAQLHDEAKVTVTLVDGSVGVHPPDDFHRDLIHLIAELADSSAAQLVQPCHDERGWRWTTEPL
jgi:hypothetical protein